MEHWSKKAVKEAVSTLNALAAHRNWPQPRPLCRRARRTLGSQLRLRFQAKSGLHPASALALCLEKYSPSTLQKLDRTGFKARFA